MTPLPAGPAEGGPAKLKTSTAIGSGPVGRPAGGGVNPVAERIEQLRCDYNRQLRASLIREGSAGAAAAGLLAWSAVHRWHHATWVAAALMTAVLGVGWWLQWRWRRGMVLAPAAIATIEQQLQLKERLLTAREWFDASGPVPRFYDALVSDLNERITPQAMAQWFPRSTRWSPATKMLIALAVLS